MTRRVARPAFDRYLIVDWSAANAPATGANSIWIAETARRPRGLTLEAQINPPTRAEAMAVIEERIALSRAAGARLFAGFDFPFGYPRGAASEIAGASGWRALWRALNAAINDGPDNCSNRFAFAAETNARLQRPLYWGRPRQLDDDRLPAKRPPPENYAGRERRLVERWRPPAKSVWQLAYNGAAGAQALVGIARLETLRREHSAHLRVWPFETRFDEDLDADIIIAEIYPAILDTPGRPGEVKDCAQARGLAADFAARDAEGRLRGVLARPAALGDEDSAAILAEEGWIAGVVRPKDSS